MREKWFDYLALYRPMVVDNTVAYIDIDKNTILGERIPADVHMSLFVNGECYLCVSNVGDATQHLTFLDEWIDRRTSKRLKSLTLAHGEVRFLQRSLPLV